MQLAALITVNIECITRIYGRNVAFHSIQMGEREKKIFRTQTSSSFTVDWIINNCLVLRAPYTQPTTMYCIYNVDIVDRKTRKRMEKSRTKYGNKTRLVNQTISFYSCCILVLHSQLFMCIVWCTIQLENAEFQCGCAIWPSL